MILYYSERGVYADIFMQTLSFFLSKPVALFSFEQQYSKPPDLLIIDGVNMHPQRLKKILRYNSPALVLLISNVPCHALEVTAQINANASVHEVADLCVGLLAKPSKLKNSMFNQKEERLFAGLQQGLSNKKMTKDSGLPLSAVKYHLQNIYAKLGVENRTQAALKLSQSAL